MAGRLVVGGVVASALLMSACASSGSGGTSTSGSSGSSRGGGSGSAGVPADSEAARAQLERDYLIGPAAARQMGYRIDWQGRTSPTISGGVTHFTVQGDSVFVLDGSNFLTRIRREDGQRMWRIAISDRTTEVFGVTHLQDVGQVFVTTGAEMLVLDSATGSQVAKQKLGHIANTGPVVADGTMLYGGRNGQLVWHNWAVGQQYRSYQISQTMMMQPLLLHNSVLAIGGDGRVMNITLGSGSMLWQARLGKAVIGKPAATADAVYIAGTDQHLWAFDADNGRMLWDYLTESALTSGPTVIGDRVYQHIPSEGLVAFEALPDNAPGGSVVWKAAAVRGSVVGQLREFLLVWNASDRQMSLVTAARGAAVEAVKLPAVRHLLVEGAQAQEIFAAGDDGRVIRLVPQQ